MRIKDILFSIGLLLLFYACGGTKQPFRNIVDGVPAPEDVVMYQVNPRVFAPAASFKVIGEYLDSIRRLGVNVVWFMPINEVGKEKSVNSPYCVKDYKSVNPEFGTMEDFRHLIGQCHDKGMSVIIDWVANHTSWDNAWMEHKDWYTQDDEGKVVSPANTGWKDVADLNFDNQEMRLAMIDAMKYWVTEIGIDGYRCDYAEGVPDAFWKKAIAELRTLDNNLLMLAEGGKTSLMNNGCNLLYGWNFHSKLKDYYAGKCSLTDLYAMNTSELEGMPKGTLRLRYSTNHDQASEASPIECYGGERGAMSAFVLTTMLVGIPLSYSSQEVAYPRSLNFFNYGVIDLKSNEVFAQEMAEIIRAYKATSSVRGGELEVYTTGDVASFYRAAGSHGMLVMVNTANESVQVKVPMEHAGKTMTDVIAGVDVELPTVMTMEPYQYFIYQQ